MRILGALVAVVGCGRIGFEPVADGASGLDAPVAEHACNTAMELGPVVPAFSPSSGTERWIATAALPAGIALARSASAGLALIPIDLTQSPPVLGAATIAANLVGNNLQVAASGDRLLTTSSTGGKTLVNITSLAFAPIAAHAEAAIAVTGPDNAVADGAGGWIVASGTGTTARIDRITADGTFVTGGAWPANDVRAGTLAGAGPGRYVAAWDTSTIATCTIRVVDETLAELASTTIACCQFARVAATADRIAVTYYTGSGLGVITLSSDLAQRSTPQAFIGGHFNPSRAISADDGFWAIIPISTTAARVNHATLQGAPETERPIVPFATDTLSYNYDVVNVQGRAYAVWLGGVTGSPSLYVERLCGS